MDITLPQQCPLSMDLVKGFLLSISLSNWSCFLFQDVNSFIFMNKCWVTPFGLLLSLIKKKKKKSCLVDQLYVGIQHGPDWNTSSHLPISPLFLSLSSLMIFLSTFISCLFISLLPSLSQALLLSFSPKIYFLSLDLSIFVRQHEKAKSFEGALFLNNIKKIFI